MPKVSIVVPVYNPGTYLRQGIESVIKQTFTDWELLIIDDDSSEDLSSICREFPLARFIKQQHSGVSVARNNGILNARGEYIAFLDQDDIWRPGKLAKQVAALDSVTDAAMCYCSLEIINDMAGSCAAPIFDKSVTTLDYIIELDGSRAPCFKGDISRLQESIKYFSSRFVVPSTVMFRRSCLATSGLLDPFTPFTGDYDVLIKLGGRYKVIRIPAVDVLYRRHWDNFSNQYQVCRRESALLGAKYKFYAKSQGDNRLAKEAKRLFNFKGKQYSAQAIDCARKSFRERNYQAMVYHFAYAFWFNPIFALKAAYCYVSCHGTRAD